MSAIDRPLSGDVLLFDLDEEQRRAEDPDALERSGRSARTLLKDGPLRATLIVLAPGGELAEHHAEGPITVQPLRGRILFRAGGEEHELEPGQLLSAGPGVPHSVHSEEGGAFLLTLTHPEAVGDDG